MFKSKMKSIFIFLSVIFFLHETKADTEQICKLQTLRNQLIKKLTKNGQKVMNHILLDIQYLTGCNFFGSLSFGGHQ